MNHHRGSAHTNNSEVRTICKKGIQCYISSPVGSEGNSRCIAIPNLALRIFPVFQKIKVILMSRSGLDNLCSIRSWMPSWRLSDVYIQSFLHYEEFAAILESFLEITFRRTRRRRNFRR